MTPEEAVTKIKATCDDISKATLQINPAIRINNVDAFDLIRPRHNAFAETKPYGKILQVHRTGHHHRIGAAHK